MKRILIGAVILLAVSSCEYKFDVSSPINGPRMVMEGIIGLDETDYIRLVKAVPVGSELQDCKSYEVKSISLKVEGEALTLSKDEEEPCYVSTNKVAAGSELSFSLSTASEPQVSATTVMPFSVEPEWKNTIVDNVLHWKMKLEGAPEDRKFALMCEYSYLYDIGEEGPIEAWSDCQISPENVGGDEAIIMFSGLRQITYSPRSGKNYDLTLLREAELTNGEFYFTTNYDAESTYRMILFNLSDEAYGYFNALYNQNNNFFGRLGFSPANFAYTNVIGGYGVFGAVCRTEKLIEL